MAMKLEKVVPFGRSLAEYIKIFSLDPIDLGRKIISVADGPSSFNAELTAKGGEVVSVDPLYAYTAKEIEAQFYSVLDDIIDQVKRTPADWVWSYHKSPEELKENRIKVIKRFVADYALRRSSDRYVEGELPCLPFADDRFDIALCSHFLFLYADLFDSEFHERSIDEMLRVAAEVRIFPLKTLQLKDPPFLAALIEKLRKKGFVAEITKVDYEMQKGGDRMLRIRKRP